MSHASRPLFAITAIALAVAVTALPARAQSSATVKSVVEKALSNNPDVSARWNALRAASEAVDAARAARGPRLDLTGDFGTERNTYKNNIPSDTLNRSGLGLSLSQVLWDGLGTRAEVERSSHERLSRYFELLEATEQTSLEAVRALYDVARYRKLVALAEDNYVQHRGSGDKILSRVKAGVGRGVDMEQANARVALSQSNLLSETSNLHDVSARYQRVVGEAPPADLGDVALLRAGLPGSAAEALQAAGRNSPAVSAAVESVRAARAAVKVREAALQPRVEARLRAGGGNNYLGLQDRRSDVAAELLMNWNLFDGGGDRARVRQQARLVDQAMDLRDKACRDAAQTALIAFNDAAKLGDQIGYLERNTAAIERARDAYRQQFDIGQRSLLDLLNAENETYTAQRALVNARFDQALAYVRTHAALSQLNQQLGLARGGQADEAPGWEAGDDAAARCPTQPVPVAAIDTAALDKRLQAAARPAAAAPAVVSAPGVSAPAAVAAPTAAAGEALSARVKAWAAAWESKDVGRYAAFYAPNFAGTQASATAWRAQRTAMLGKPGAIGVQTGPVAVSDLGGGLMQTRFQQNYTSSNFRDVSAKALTWKNIDGQWLIVKESNR